MIRGEWHSMLGLAFMFLIIFIDLLVDGFIFPWEVSSADFFSKAAVYEVTSLNFGVIYVPIDPKLGYSMVWFIETT